MKINPATHIKARLILFCILLLFIQPLYSHALSPNAPDNLRCCDKAYPVGTEERPYFGWYMNDPDDNEIQTAYQILVASSEGNLDANKGDLWDSSRINSEKQNYIDYDGKPLTPATRCYWKVRTWDKDGNAGPYSATALFDTGLFAGSDWSGAKWIKRDTTDTDDYTYFRKKVALPKKTIQRAIVYVTAGHNYELYINGNMIGKGLAYHYPQYHYYNAYDITSALNSNADNAFACLTHWFGGGQGRPSGSRGFLLGSFISPPHEQPKASQDHSANHDDGRDRTDGCLVVG